VWASRPEAAERPPSISQRGVLEEIDRDFDDARHRAAALKTLGLAVSPALLADANEVIE
jgi:hypothetical protein